MTQKHTPEGRASGVCSLFLGSPLCCEGILLHGALDVRIADVRIDLRGVELLVTQDLLQHAHVYLPGLIHQRGGGVAELMYRVSLGAKSRGAQILVDHGLHGLDADALFQAA